MGFTTCKKFQKSGHTLYCGHRDGTAFNGMKDCAFMPKNQTVWGFEHEDKCRKDCKALKKLGRFQDGSDEYNEFECISEDSAESGRCCQKIGVKGCYLSGNVKRPANEKTEPTKTQPSCPSGQTIKPFYS